MKCGENIVEVVFISIFVFHPHCDMMWVNILMVGWCHQVVTTTHTLMQCNFCKLSFNATFFYEHCHSLKKMSPMWAQKLFVFIIILLFNDFMFVFIFLYLVFFLCFSHDCNLFCFNISSCDHHLKLFNVLHVTFKYVFFTQLRHVLDFMFCIGFYNFLLNVCFYQFRLCSTLMFYILTFLLLCYLCYTCYLQVFHIY